MSYNRQLYILVVFIILILIIYLSSKSPYLTSQRGGSLSPLAGPVDLLQAPKGLIMDGYRFQDTMFPPYPLKTTSSLYTQENSDSLDGHCREGGNLNPLMRQRVGFFKHIENSNFQVQPKNPSIRQRGEVFKYTEGSSVNFPDPTFDQSRLSDPLPLEQASSQPFKTWIHSASYHTPFPNRPLSWGDTISRYQNQLSLNGFE